MRLKAVAPSPYDLSCLWDVKHKQQQNNILKGLFCIKLCWYLILKKLVSKGLKFGPKWYVLYFKPILAAIFDTMADFYTSSILLTNQSEEIGEKQFSVFGFRGGQISP